MLSQLSILLFVNVGGPLHTSSLQMRQQIHEVRFYPSICWDIFYRCLFQSQLEVVVSISGILLFRQAPIRDCNFALSISTCLSEVVSCEHWTKQTKRSGRILKRPMTNLPLRYNCFNLLLRSSTYLKTIISNGPIESQHWGSLRTGLQFDLFRVADWLQVLWDCFGDSIVVAYPLPRFKSMLWEKKL